MAPRTDQHRSGGQWPVATHRTRPGRRAADRPTRLVAGVVAATLILLGGCDSASAPRPAASPPPAGSTTLTGDAVEDLAGQLHPETSDTAAGSFEHIVSRTGDTAGVGRPVGPQQRREYWTNGAGSGRVLHAMLIDTDPTSVTVRCPASDQRWTDQIGMWDGPIPADANTLLLWLLPHSLDEEPDTTLTLILLRRVTDLYANRLVPPASRTALLRMLARQPGLTFDLVDGTDGRWLSITMTGHELVAPSGTAAPTGRMLVFDADTGNLVWSEVFPLTGQPSTSPDRAATATAAHRQQQMTVTITGRDRSADAEHPGHVCAATP